MLKFKDFLIEARASQGAIDPNEIHLPHPSSFGHMNGGSGTEMVMNALSDLYKHVSRGSVPPGASVKADGAPAIDMEGPTNRHVQGSVATKSQAIAKNPKINASHEDVDANYGEAEKLGLNHKLKSVLDVIPKILPPGMKVKADIMHGGGKTTHTETIDGVPHTMFSSNLIRYGVPTDSPEAERIANSKIGLAIHGIYDKTGKLRPISQQELGMLNDHPDVHVMSLQHDNPPVVTPEQAKRVQGHLKAAAAFHQALSPQVDEIGNPTSSGYDAVLPHGLDLETYVNHTIRQGVPQHVGGFMQWLQDRGEKQASKVVTEPAKNRKRAEAQKIIAHVKANKHHFDNALRLQQELEGATNVLSDTMNNTHRYRAFIGDQETGPEGHYINHKGVSLKIVRRRPDEGSTAPAFSQANLQQGRFQKQAKK